MYVSHNSDVIWALRCLKPPAVWLIVKQLVPADIIEISKLCITNPL